MAKRISTPKANTGKTISAKSVADTNRSVARFSFQRIQRGDYCFSGLSTDHKAAVGDALFRRKGMTWNEITLAPRHGLGTEKIPKKSINKEMPACITEDMDHLLVMRYSGLNPMVGYRIGDTFFILWFDHDFSLYPHG